jgi:hypothetical protein
MIPIQKVGHNILCPEIIKTFNVSGSWSMVITVLMDAENKRAVHIIRFA